MINHAIIYLAEFSLKKIIIKGIFLKGNVVINVKQ